MMRGRMGRRPRIGCDDEEGLGWKGDVVAAIAGSVALVLAEVAARKLWPELFEPKEEEKDA